MTDSPRTVRPALAAACLFAAAAGASMLLAGPAGAAPTPTTSPAAPTLRVTPVPSVAPSSAVTSAPAPVSSPTVAPTVGGIEVPAGNAGTGVRDSADGAGDVGAIALLAGGVLVVAGGVTVAATRRRV